MSKETPQQDGPQGRTEGGSGKPDLHAHDDPVKLGISITKCEEYFSPSGVGFTDFTAKIYKCQGTGWVECDVEAQITFMLYYVSNLAGFCMNGGREDAFAPDLWFSKDENGTDEWKYPLDNSTAAPNSDECEKKILGMDNEPGHFHYQWIQTKGVKNEATVTVRSEDYGAWGWIETTAPGCLPLPPREDKDSPVPCPPGSGCCTAAGPVPGQIAYVRDGAPKLKQWKSLTGVIMANWVKIPRDGNNNNIPDNDNMARWDSGNDGQSGAERDIDQLPAGMGDGDGFTVFEEYRGFVREDGSQSWYHVRTDPNKKTVFVYLPKNDKYFADLKDLVDSPIAFFTRTGLEIYKITEKYNKNGSHKFVKIHDDNSNVELNFNRDWARGKPKLEDCSQSAIWLRGNPEMPKGWFGFACSARKANPALTKAGREKAGDLFDPPSQDEGTPGTPGLKTHCCINVKLCKSDIKHPDRLNQVVAHELGHAVNFQHHGEGGVHAHSDGMLGCWRGLLTSGDEDCVMHYDTVSSNIKWWCEPDSKTVKDVLDTQHHAVYYPNTVGPGGTGIPVQDWSGFQHDPNVGVRDSGRLKGVPLDMHAYSNDGPGTTYCSAQAGTGDNNEDGKNNRATLGGCRGYLKVKDWT